MSVNIEFILILVQLNLDVYILLKLVFIYI